MECRESYRYVFQWVNTYSGECLDLTWTHAIAWLEGSKGVWSWWLWCAVKMVERWCGVEERGRFHALMTVACQSELGRKRVSGEGGICWEGWGNMLPATVFGWGFFFRLLILCVACEWSLPPFIAQLFCDLILCAAYTFCVWDFLTGCSCLFGGPCKLSLLDLLICKESFWLHNMRVFDFMLLAVTRFSYESSCFLLHLWDVMLFGSLRDFLVRCHVFWASLDFLMIFRDYLMRFYALNPHNFLMRLSNEISYFF